MPVYKKGPQKYYVIVVVNGRRKDKTVHGTREEAEAYEAELKVEMRKLARSEFRTVPLFSDFCVANYSPHAKATLADQTWTNRSYQLASLIEWFGDVRLDRIDRQLVDRFIADRRAAGMKPSTINDALKVLKRVVNYAVELKAPVQPLSVPMLTDRAARSRRVKLWTSAQVQALFVAAEETSPAILPLMVFLANTGCRKTEALRVKWSGVRVDDGVIDIEYVADDVEEGIGEWAPKDGEVRQVPLSASLRPILQRLKAENDARKRPSAFVFVSRTGKPWKTWPQLQFDRARKQAGLEGGPHTLRHTYASHFLAARPDLFRLSKILGHSSERTTLLYAHMLPDAVASSAVVDFSPDAGKSAEERAKAVWNGRKPPTS